VTFYTLGSMVRAVLCVDASDKGMLFYGDHFENGHLQSRFQFRVQNVSSVILVKDAMPSIMRI
jgi:hypothetical protein